MEVNLILVIIRANLRNFSRQIFSDELVETHVTPEPRACGAKAERCFSCLILAVVRGDFQQAPVLRFARAWQDIFGFFWASIVAQASCLLGNRASRLVDSLPVRPVAGKMPAPALQPRWLCCLPPSAATTRNAPEEPVMLSYPGGL